jgi:hypothetical protein
MNAKEQPLAAWSRRSREARRAEVRRVTGFPSRLVGRLHGRSMLTA